MKKIQVLLFLLICTGCVDKVIQPSFEITPTPVSSEDTYHYLNQSLDSFIFAESELPFDIEGKTVDWQIQEGNAQIVDNKIIKTKDAKEYEPLILKLVLNDKELIFDNIVLLDPRVAHVMSYFGGSEEDYENPKLAYTYDGMLWFLLNNDKPIFEAKIGTTQVRDPFLVRMKDGSFAMIATQGWNNPSIYAWDSKDGVTFDNERLLQVNKSSSQLKMSEKHAWAPEAFYDRRIDKYVIYWSSPEDGGMFYNLSPDLNEISYPKKLLETGYPVIDGTIIKNGYNYTIVLKDEREPMEEHSQLFLGYSDSDYLGFDEFSDTYITGHQSEGPFYMKRDYDYILYYDDYTRKQFQAMITDDIRSGEFDEVNMLSDVVAPMEQPRHASVIPVTWKELERFIGAYAQ